MNLSLFFARFFGLYLIITGFAYLFRRHFIRKASTQIFEQESLIIITAIISLIIGLCVVVTHSVWEFNWKILITIIGYLSLIKGVLRLYIPHTTDKKLFTKMLAGDNPIYIGMVCLIIGFFLTYEGFLGGI